MKKVLLGISFAVLLALLSPATAQAKTYDWSGAYVGANFGGAFGHVNPDTDVAPTGSGIQYFTDTDYGQVNEAGEKRFQANGLSSGAQAGYNFQHRRWVYGLETEFDYFNLDRSQSTSKEYLSAPGFDLTVRHHISTNWLYTLRPKVGISLGRLLIYATGGMALTQLKFSEEFSDNFIFVPTGAYGSSSTSKTRAGWVLGAGTEYALSRHWTVKAEYLYIDFQQMTIRGGALEAPQSQDQFTHSVDLNVHTIRMGINYKF